MSAAELLGLLLLLLLLTLVALAVVARLTPRSSSSTPAALSGSTASAASSKGRDFLVFRADRDGADPRGAQGREDVVCQLHRPFKIGFEGPAGYLGPDLLW